MDYRPVTTTLDDQLLIDSVGFGLMPTDLRSLRALGSVWPGALWEAAERIMAGTAAGEFVEISAGLPAGIGDPDWQERWLRAWQDLVARGTSPADLLVLFTLAAGNCERALYGDRSQLSRLHVDLCAILHRCAAAAVCGVLQFGEKANRVAAALPDEHAAIRRLGELAEAAGKVAVLSMSMVNRQALAYLSASDLQRIPALLAERLAASLRREDEVFVGRDVEWLLLLPDVRSLASPALAAMQLRRAFAEPLQLPGGRGVVLDVVVGAAMLPEHGGNPEEVIHAARLARATLVASHEPFAMFQEGLRDDWQFRHLLAEELNAALHDEELALYLQPQVDLASGTCFGAELLLRWRRRNGQWVAPPVVVDIIEENGWHSLFTSWLLRTAARTAAELQAAAVDIRVSLNLTPADLLDTDLPEVLAQSLQTWRVAPGRIAVELTETAMMGDRERGFGIMRRLRELGVFLALDDFGTGYSSLSYLATLALDEIKIDRSFVIGMGASADGLRIVRTIIDLTRDLGMVPLAEGIEDQAQRDQLFALGCEAAQGYFYGKPMPFDEFVAWYRQRQA